MTLFDKRSGFSNGHLLFGQSGGLDGVYNIGVDTRTGNNLNDGMRPGNVFIRNGIVAGNIFNLNAPYGINNAGLRGAIVAGDAMANTVALMGGSTVLYGGTQTFHGFAKDSSFATIPSFFNLNSLTDYDVYFGQLNRFTSNLSLMKFGGDGSLSLLSSTGSFINFHQISTPSSTPGSGTNYLYFKSDDNLYAKNSAGVESRIGGSESATWTKYTVSYTALATAGTTNSITLFTASAKTVITGVIIKHSTNFIGGTLSAYTVSVGQSGNNTQFASAFDVFQAVSNSAFQSTDEQQLTDFASPVAVTITATSAGDNLNSATQGSVDIWVLSSTLP
jgi:hypothetical protein